MWMITYQCSPKCRGREASNIPDSKQCGLATLRQPFAIFVYLNLLEDDAPLCHSHIHTLGMPELGQDRIKHHSNVLVLGETWGAMHQKKKVGKTNRAVEKKNDWIWVVDINIRHKSIRARAETNACNYNTKQKYHACSLSSKCQQHLKRACGRETHFLLLLRMLERCSRFLVEPRRGGEVKNRFARILFFLHTRKVWKEWLLGTGHGCTCGTLNFPAPSFNLCFVSEQRGFMKLRKCDQIMRSIVLLPLNGDCCSCDKSGGPCSEERSWISGHPSCREMVKKGGLRGWVLD